ncbi:MAG: Cerebroside-sulfatase, partial [Armatimonadota bacterium]
SDPGQTIDVAEHYPDVVRRLRLAHEERWNEVRPLLDEYCPISIGADEENPTRLNAMDVMGDVAWNQPHIRAAQRSTGRWAVEVEKAGHYTFELQRWPKELGLPIDAELQEMESSAIHPSRARLSVGHFEATTEVPEGAESVTFEADLQPGRADLDAWFINDDDEERGAYYVYIERH